MDCTPSELEAMEQLLDDMHAEQKKREKEVTSGGG